MSIFQSLLDAYTAPEMRAAQAPKNTADAWGQVMAGMQPQPTDTSTDPAQAPAPMSPIDRWRKQINLMMQSGDPTLQQQAMGMMQKYHESALGGQTKLGAYGQHARDMGLTPGTKPFRDMVERLATQARTTVVQSGDKQGYLTDEEKVQGGLDPEGVFVWKNGMPTPVKSSSYTGDQLTAAGYGERMLAAENELDELHANGFDPTTVQQKVGEVVPYVGSKLQTEGQQVATRAMRDWIRAKLRKESGAVIADSEMEAEVETYFPQPGDRPAVIEAKRRARQTAMEAMSIMSGGKFKMPRTEEVKKQIEKEAEAIENFDPSKGVMIDGQFWEFVDEESE